MNLRQHISTRLERFFGVLLPGGCWRLGRRSAERCEAKPVAIRATHHRAMPCRAFDRGHRKA